MKPALRPHDRHHWSYDPLHRERPQWGDMLNGNVLIGVVAAVSVGTACLWLAAAISRAFATGGLT
jgi:hypothetical protein